MTFPDDRKYTRSHLWLQKCGDVVCIGITAFQREGLGKSEFVDLLNASPVPILGHPFMEWERELGTFRIPWPVSGKLVAFGEEKLEEPGLVDDDPYGTWIVQVTTIHAMEPLLSAEEYASFCAEEMV